MAFLNTLWALSLQKKIFAGIAVALVVIAMMALIRTATKPPMALLYAGVDSMAASEIVTKLDAENIIYELDGERIYVEASSRDRLRLTLAQEGLPRQSVAGYELLDNLSGFSTTSDMFSAAYWRAKEGELTRTLLTMPGIRAARVHIGSDERSPFSRNRTPRTASVIVTAPSGLSSGQIKAIQHVTALAVSNLQPEAVAVADTNRGLLTKPAGAGANDELMDEDKRTAAMEADLLRMIEARVGPGNAQVTVALQISREREAFTEQVIDPETAVVTSRTRNEMTEAETGANGAVTIASDLPDGEAVETETNTERNETREEVEYAVSTRDRTVEKLPGEIQRMTIAVLLNHLPPIEGEEESRPRPPEEIAALRDLIETAAGIDEARGDRVTLQTLPFEKPVLSIEEPAAATSPLSGIEPRLWHIGQLALLSIVVIVLGLFVVKPILTQSPTQDADSATAIAALGGPLATTAIQDPVTMLRDASSNETEAAAALLNAWLEEEEAA